MAIEFQERNERKKSSSASLPFRPSEVAITGVRAAGATGGCSGDWNSSDRERSLLMEPALPCPEAPPRNFPRSPGEGALPKTALRSLALAAQRSASLAAERSGQLQLGAPALHGTFRGGASGHGRAGSMRRLLFLSEEFETTEQPPVAFRF